MLSEAMPVRSWQLPRVFAVSTDASSWVVSLSQLVRVRVASVDLNWAHTTFSVGQDKPKLVGQKWAGFSPLKLAAITPAAQALEKLDL